ncbi:hypothetical protein LTR62_008054 [Meristemomyces frigidus]|uniref:Uncharacterized protein n=1 Tax=Meristemomyces frigidus TaxID=1508187 RepID=A0AAN7TPK5_9PEZI|nr:hypothetical protein LTR62_008054 [Meristemomyces frigidus]
MLKLKIGVAVVKQDRPARKQDGQAVKQHCWSALDQRVEARRCGPLAHLDEPLPIAKVKTEMEPDSRILQACIDDEDETYFRVLLNGNTIRYLTIAAGVYTVPEMCFSPTSMSLLPTLPSGDWNEALISQDHTTGRPYFKTWWRRSFSAVTSVWHLSRINYLDLQLSHKGNPACTRHLLDIHWIDALSNLQPSIGR